MRERSSETIKLSIIIFKTNTDRDQAITKAILAIPKINSPIRFNMANANFINSQCRTQRLFIEHLAVATGYEINWSKVQQWQINDVAIQSFKGNFEPTIFMFEKIVQPLKKDNESSCADGEH